MVNMNQQLGREVVTTAEVLSLIRGELRIMRASYRGVVDAIRAGWIDASPDLELTDGNDKHADEAVFEALRESAMGNVIDWCGDEGRVFDKGKVTEFIRQALIAACYLGDDHPELLPLGSLDY